MTRFPIPALALCMITMSVSATYAYETDPAADMLHTVSQVSLVAENTTQTAGTCAVTITPKIAAMLGLDADWRTGDDRTSNAVACLGDQ